jgi:hypothetical protein
VYAVLVGDDWQTIMYDTIRAQGIWTIVYFISLIIIGNIILISLFLAILFGNFETEEIDEERKMKKLA